MLAAIGLYGVLAQFVTQSTHEIGIRMAIGAARGDITALVARKGGVPLLLGLIAGFALSLILTRYAASLLYDVSASDPFTFAAVGLIVIAAAFAGALLPARRAWSVDPMITLRGE